MSALVIKSWRAEDSKPIDNQNNFISIVGREGGIVAWILSLMGVDPTTSILVGSERIEFSSASLAGTESRLLPLQSVCSTYYGYHKPWKIAAGIVAIFIFIALGAAQDGSEGGAFILTLIGFAIALAYYFLNRTLTLGFVENSGVTNGIRFKRSIIENKEINQEQAKSVCIIIQHLIENKEKRENTVD